jgi:hypothetical protein
VRLTCRKGGLGEGARRSKGERGNVVGRGRPADSRYVRKAKWKQRQEPGPGLVAIGHRRLSAIRPPELHSVFCMWYLPPPPPPPQETGNAPAAASD